MHSAWPTKPPTSALVTLKVSLLAISESPLALRVRTVLPVSHSSTVISSITLAPITGAMN